MSNINEKDARVCPNCGYRMDYKVGTKIARVSEHGFYVRYKKCEKCHVNYKTYEIHEDLFNKMNKIYSAIKAISE